MVPSNSVLSPRSRWIAMVFAAVLATLLFSPAAHAANYYWDTNGVAADSTSGTIASGTWGASQENWNTDPTGGNAGVFTDLPTSTDDVTFSAGMAATGTNGIFVSGTQAVAGITITDIVSFNGAATTVDGGLIIGADGITLTGSAKWLGAASLNTIQLAASQSWTDNSILTAASSIFPSSSTLTTPAINLGAVTLTLSGSNATSGFAILRGPFDNSTGSTLALQKSGVGTWQLTSLTSNYSGGFTLNTGEIDVANSSVGGVGAVTAGPLGTGTLTINGGTIGAPTAAETIANTLVDNADFGLGGAHPITLSAGLDLGGGTRTITTSGTGGGILTGFVSDGSLGVNGTGSLTLNNAETFAGGITVTSGSLILGAAGSLGAGNYSGAIADNGAFFDNSSTAQTLSSTITGSGTLGINAAAANLTLAGANSGFAGNIALTSGTLHIGTNAAVGTSLLNLNGGVLNITADLSGANALSNSINFGASTTITGSNNLTLAGPIVTGAAHTLTDNLANGGLLTLSSTSIGIGTGAAGAVFTVSGSGNYLISGNLVNNGGAGAFTSGGTGTVTLTGSNSLTGIVIAQAGSTLSVNSIAMQLGTAQDIFLGGGSLPGRLLYTGSGETTTVPLGSTASSAGSNLIVDQSGSGLLAFTSNFVNQGATVTRSLTLQGSTSGNGLISGVIDDSTGAGTPTVSLIKAGSNTWTLAGANTYSGGTTVKAGSLIVSGSLKSTGAVVVGDTNSLSTTATLGGSGSVGNVSAVGSGNEATSGATVDPGNTAGVAGIMTTGSFSLTSGAHLAAQIGGDTAGGESTTGYDEIVAGSAVTLTGGDLELTLMGTPNFSGSDTLYLIINNSGTAPIGTFSTVFLNGSAVSNTSDIVLNGQAFALVYNANYVGAGTDSVANDVALQEIAVPEPGTWAMLLGGIGILGVYRRKRRNTSS